MTAADDVTAVGHLVCGIKNRVQARIAGLVLIQEALTTLAVLYGYANHPPSRSRLAPAPKGRNAR